MPTGTDNVCMCRTTRGVAQTASLGGTRRNSTDESALGYILLIVSTVLYAVYEVMYRYLAPNDPDNELTAPLLVLGLIGVMTGQAWAPRCARVRPVLTLLPTGNAERTSVHALDWDPHRALGRL